MKKYSQFKAMFAISRASFRSITRSPSAVVFSLAFPMIFIIVFGFIGRGGGFSTDVALKQGSDTSNPFYFSLEKSPVINLITTKSDSDIANDLSKGRIDAAISIKKNTGDSTMPAYLLNVQEIDTNGKGRVVNMTLNNAIISAINIKYPGALTPFVNIKTEEAKFRPYKTIDFILPGQLGFSILSAGVFGTAFVFYSLRSTLVLKRFFATPIRREYIVLGECLARLVFQLIGAVIIILIGWSVFGFTLVHGFTTLLQMLVLSTIGLVIFMGMGFVVSGLAKNESAIPPVANIFTLPQFLLAGTFFPIDVFPNWLQPVCKILPLTYLNDAMRKVAFEGASFINPAVDKDLLILAIWGVVVYFIAVKTFRWE